MVGGSLRFWHGTQSYRAASGHSWPAVKRAPGEPMLSWARVTGVVRLGDLSSSYCRDGPSFSQASTKKLRTPP
jgi:hypothetical protein